MRSATSRPLLLETKLSQRQFSIGLVVATAIGVVLGAATLTREPLGNDEIASLALVSRSLHELGLEFARSQSAGSVFHLAIWPIVQLGGVSSFWLRLPSLVAFGSAIPFCGLVGARLGGRAAGVCAALFLAVCPFVVFHAQDARMYTFALLWSLVSFWCLLRALEHPGVARWAAYAGAVAVTGYSHEFALLTVIAHVPLVLVDRRRRSRRDWVLALGAAAALLAPLAVVSAHNRASDPLYYLTAPGRREIVDTVLAYAGSRPAAAISSLVVVAGIVAALALRASLPAASRRRGWAVATSVGLWALAPSVVLLAASQLDALFVPRYVIPSAAGASLALSLSVGLLDRRLGLAAGGLVFLVLAYGAINGARVLERPDWPGVAAWLRASSGDRPIVLVGGQRNAAALLYYTPDLAIARDRLPWAQEELARIPRRLVIIDRDNSLGDLRGALRGGPAWVVEQGLVQPDKQKSFDRFLDSCEEQAQNDFRLISVRLLTRCPAAPG